jgi:hypothetical protein
MHFGLIEEAAGLASKLFDTHDGTAQRRSTKWLVLRSTPARLAGHLEQYFSKSVADAGFNHAGRA